MPDFSSIAIPVEEPDFSGIATPVEEPDFSQISTVDEKATNRLHASNSVMALPNQPRPKPVADAASNDYADDFIKNIDIGKDAQRLDNVDLNSQVTKIINKAMTVPAETHGPFPHPENADQQHRQNDYLEIQSQTPTYLQRVAGNIAPLEPTDAPSITKGGRVIPGGATGVYQAIGDNFKKKRFEWGSWIGDTVEELTLPRETGKPVPKASGRLGDIFGQLLSAPDFFGLLTPNPRDEIQAKGFMEKLGMMTGKAGEFVAGMNGVGSMLTGPSLAKASVAEKFVTDLIAGSAYVGAVSAAESREADILPTLKEAGKTAGVFAATLGASRLAQEALYSTILNPKMADTYSALAKYPARVAAFFADDVAMTMPAVASQMVNSKNPIETLITEGPPLFVINALVNRGFAGGRGSDAIVKNEATVKNVTEKLNANIQKHLADPEVPEEIKAELRMFQEHFGTEESLKASLSSPSTLADDIANRRITVASRPAVNAESRYGVSGGFVKEFADRYGPVSGSDKQILGNALDEANRQYDVLGELQLRAQDRHDELQAQGDESGAKDVRNDLIHIRMLRRSIATDKGNLKKRLSPIEIKVNEDKLQEQPIEPTPIPDALPAAKTTPEAPPTESVPVTEQAPDTVSEPKTSRPPGDIGLTLEAVKSQRAARGESPLEPPDPQENQQQYEEAMSRYHSDPQEPIRLEAEITANPRTLTPVEHMMLAQREKDLTDEFYKAADAVSRAKDEGRDEDVPGLIGIMNRWSDAATSLEKATAAAGTEWGRAGQARKRKIANDFTLANLTKRARAAKGGDNLNEPELDRLRKIADDYKAANDKYQKRIAELESVKPQEAFKEAVDRTEKEVKAAKKKPKKDINRKSMLDRAMEAIEARQETLRKERGGTLTSGFNPEYILNETALLAIRVTKGVVKFAEWSKGMITRHGKEIEPQLKAIWQDAHSNKEKHLVYAENLLKTTESKKDILEKINTKIDGDPEADISLEVQRLARMFVEEGIDNGKPLTRDELLDKVHKEVVKILPDMKKREAQDAISGYGKYKQLSKDEISTQLRDLKGQMQQISKLEDMQKGRAPLATGVERPVPGDEWRRLIREVNEAKKKGGFVVTDTAKQLRTAEQAIKRRLTNQISDLDRQVKAKQKDIKVKTASPTNDEIKSLEARRDELRAAFDEMFGKNEMTPERRVNTAIKAAEKSLAELERRVKEGDLFPEKKPSKTPLTPELVAVRAKRDAMREQLKELQDIARPPKNPEERYNQAFKTRTANRIADLEQRMAEGNFSKKAKNEPPSLDPESIKAKYELDKVVERYHQQEFQWQMANRSRIKKSIDAAAQTVQTARAVMTGLDLSAIFRQGGFIAMGHPIRAIRASADMLRAARSEEGAYAVMEKIKNNPNYALYKKSGLYLAEKGNDLSDMEEVYMSRWADKIPGIAASQRAYITFLNKLRADSFDAMAATLSKGGKGLNDVEAKAISSFINEATGRGKVGISDQTAVGLNTAFFAPRLVASRFNLLIGRPIWQLGGGTARTRALVAGEYARYLVGMGVVYALAKAAGLEVGTDPTSTEFGKIKVGNTWIDPLSGFAQMLTFAGRMLFGATTSATGLKTELGAEGSGYGSKTRGDVITHFLRSKLSPAFGVIADYATGKTYGGKDFKLSTGLSNIVLPMSMNDIYTAIKEHGVPAGSALGLLSVLGMGVNTYGRAGLGEDAVDLATGAKAIKDIVNEEPEGKITQYLNEISKSKEGSPEEERLRSEATDYLSTRREKFSGNKEEDAKTSKMQKNYSHQLPQIIKQKRKAANLKDMTP